MGCLKPIYNNCGLLKTIVNQNGENKKIKNYLTSGQQDDNIMIYKQTIFF